MSFRAVCVVHRYPPNVKGTKPRYAYAGPGPGLGKPERAPSVRRWSHFWQISTHYAEKSRICREKTRKASQSRAKSREPEQGPGWTVVGRQRRKYPGGGQEIDHDTVTSALLLYDSQA